MNEEQHTQILTELQEQNEHLAHIQTFVGILAAFVVLGLVCACLAITFGVKGLWP